MSLRFPSAHHNITILRLHCQVSIRAIVRIVFYSAICEPDREKSRKWLFDMQRDKMAITAGLIYLLRPSRCLIHGVYPIFAVLMSCLHNEPSVGDWRAKALCLAGRKAETSTAPWKNRILTQAQFNPDPAGYNLRNRCRLRGNPWD